MGSIGEELRALDAALGGLRRLWDNPETRRWLARQLGEHVELSLYRTLRAIEHAPDPAGVREVAEHLGVSESGTSRLVDQAVLRGYVVRETSPEDRRRTVLTLTPEGAALLARATEARTALLARLTSDWSPDEVATLAHLLDRLTRSRLTTESFA